MPVTQEELLSECGKMYIDVEDLVAVRDRADKELHWLRSDVLSAEEGEEKRDAELELREWLEENESAHKELRRVLGEVGVTEGTLIHDSKINSYLEQEVDDLYGEEFSRLPSFVRVEINYDELKMDYSSVEFCAKTYWVRVT